MENMADTQAATPENVWAFLRELAVRQAENERILTEKFAETDRKIEKVSQTVGSWANNHGSFAEEYFFNSFENGKQNFFGEKFDEIEKNVKGLKKDFKDEYDILLINGKSVGIVEVKYKAHENDVDKVLRKAETFRVNFPEYADHKIYLGLATLSFYPELEQECINEGIAVVKQVGDTVVINDEHLKAF
jgi:Holliday junction resolvase-like predicted endonuclease